MINQLKNWKNHISIDGQDFESVDQLSNFDFRTLSNESVIILHHNTNTHVGEQSRAFGEHPSDAEEVTITVKSYMTKKSTPEFDFMAQWNDNNPMPLMVMTGHKIRETRGMVCMELHGDIVQKIMPVCMKCGKIIENPVSQFFGMGPICGKHNYINTFDTEEELEDAVNNYRQELRNIKWTGWIPKSAIISEVPVENRVV